MISREAYCRFRYGVAVLVLSTGCFIPYVQAAPCPTDGTAPTKKPVPVRSIRSLNAIEKGLIPKYDQGKARFDGLWDYFRDANPNLVSHLDKQIQKYHQGQSHCGVTYVAGASGVGKSYVIRQLGFPEDVTTDPIKLGKIFSEKSPDLQSLDEDVVFNSLPTSSGISIKRLLQRQQATDKAFVLIDDLDEIDEQSAHDLLQQLETYINTRPQGFKHFIVFGRPEGFWPWLNSPERSLSDNISQQPFTLVGPDFKTTGDIVFRCQDYYAWKYKQPAPEALVNEVLEQLERYPYLRYTFRPLSAGNFILDNSIDTKKEKAPPQAKEKELRQELFRSLLERNHETHQRPSVDDKGYMELLENAAAFPLAHNRKLNDQGFFEVRQEDSLTFTDTEGHCRSVRLRDLLSRSGIALLDPSQAQKTLYRFEPFWIHGYLLERFNSHITR